MTEPSPQLRELWTKTDAALAAGEIEQGVDLEIRAWVDGPFRAPDEVEPQVREAIREMNRRVWERAASEPPPASSEPPVDRVARLGEIAIPTLLIEGTLDQPDVAVSMEPAGARAFPRRARLLCRAPLDFPNIERAEIFNAALRDFLERVL